VDGFMEIDGLFVVEWPSSWADVEMVDLSVVVKRLGTVLEAT